MQLQSEFTPETIRLLVDTFYFSVKADPFLGNYFNEEAQINWEHHLPRMYAFWETMILGTATYGGSLMGTHLNMHQKAPMEPAHFQAWLKHFHAAAESLFIPELAQDIKFRTMAMGANIQMKIRKG